MLKIIPRATSVLLALSCGTALAITPADLQRQLASGAHPTLIDVRSTDLFSKGHLPEAINVPAALCPQKTLPKLGAVIVYGDGIDIAVESAALAAINAKPGITAELLDGGYSAWESLQGSTSALKGLSPEKINYITYQQLATNTGDLVLVDLRKEPVQQRQGVSGGPAPAPLTDLGKAFPGKTVTRSPFNLPQKRQSVGGSSATPLLVLIDSGDGKAQETARMLRANGNARVVILAGGEDIIARQGQSGSQRTGMNLQNLNSAVSGGKK